MASVKTLEPFKWTFLSANRAVLDADPTVSLFDSQHTEVSLVFCDDLGAGTNDLAL